MNDTEITYNRDREPYLSLLEEMYIEKGTIEDWNKLSDLHYKMSSLPVGASHWKLVFRGETIGVCVISVPKGLLKERHALFPNAAPGANETQISNIHRYAWINDNFKVVGRFVIDTMFRSGGLAYRFLNIASRMQTHIRFIEIQSSMAAYNPFAQKAGFEMVAPQRSSFHDKGLRFMRQWFNSHPSDAVAIMEEFDAMPAGLQKRCEASVKDFYYRHSSLEKTGGRRSYSDKVVDGWSMRRTISKIQNLCFASPIYGVYVNPDNGRELPSRIPLLSYDLQKPNEPLRLDLLDTVPGWDKLK